MGPGSTLGHKPRLMAGPRAVCTEQHQCTSLPKISKIGHGGGVNSGLTAAKKRCCCYGSKPGCLLGAFWLFSSSPKTSWAEKIKFCQKELLYGGPQLKYRSQSTAATMELSKCGWSWGPFGCSCMTAAIQAGYTKNSRSGFIFLPKSFFCQRLKFSLESIPEDASIAPMMASYG